MVLVDQLAGPRQPVVEVFLVGHGVLVLGRAVKAGETRVFHVRIELHPIAEEPPVLGPVRRKAEDEPLAANRLGKLADNVAFRAHLRGVPVRKPTVVHGESVVVLGHGNDKLRARLAEQFRPMPGSNFSALNWGMKSL